MVRALITIANFALGAALTKRNVADYSVLYMDEAPPAGYTFYQSGTYCSDGFIFDGKDPDCTQKCSVEPSCNYYTEYSNGYCQMSSSCTNPQKALDASANTFLKALKCQTSLVFDIGLPRTGTTAFADYTKKLGYRSITLDNQHNQLSLMKDFVEGRNRASNYFSHKLWQQEHYAFSDWPYFAIACELLRAKPHGVDAKFVLVERDWDAYAASMRVVYCEYEACNEHKWGDLFQWFYGSPALRALEQCKLSKKDMCASSAEDNSIWQEIAVGFKLQAKQFHKTVSQCFAGHQEKLLRLKLEDSDELKGRLITDFLGCNYKASMAPSMGDARDHHALWKSKGSRVT